MTVGANSPGSTSPVPTAATEPRCDFCGLLGWTVEKYGRVTHKQACPHRADPWHQGDPTATAAPDRDAARLLELIRLIDLGRHSADLYDGGEMEYIEIRRWKGSDNDLDNEATDLIRGLLRERLGGLSLEAIGAATLTEVDRGF